MARWLVLFTLTALLAVLSIVVDSKPLAAAQPRTFQADSPGKRSKIDTSNHHQLLPAVHPYLNRRSLAHLTPRDSQDLFYAQHGSINIQQNPMVATVAAKFHAYAVILDHSAHITSVTCLPRLMTVEFDNESVYYHSKLNWTAVPDVVFVSSAAGCHTEYPGQYGFFNSSSIAWDDVELSAAVTGVQVPMKHAVAEYDVGWGVWEDAPPQETQTIERRAFGRTTTSSKIASTSSKPSSSSSVRASSSSNRATSSSVLTTKPASSSPSSTKPASSSPSSSKPGSSASSGSSSPAKSGSSTITSSAVSSSSFVSSTLSSSSSSTSASCGALPTTIPAGLPKLTKAFKCDTNFDANLDDYLGTIGGSSDPQDKAALFLPGISTTSERRRGMRNRRWDIIGDIVSAGKAIAHGIEKAVDTGITILKETVQVLSEAGQAAVNFLHAAAEALLPSFSPSVVFTIPINMGAPDAMLEDAPWGKAYKLFEYAQGQGDINYGINAATLARLTGANELLTFKINGVEQLPTPGVKLYCVNCGVHGNLRTTGQATFTLGAGFTQLKLSFDGVFTATVQLGLDAFAEVQKDLFSKRILTYGLPGFWIPEVIAVGPILTLDVDANVKVEALGQLLAGATLEWKQFGATVNFFDISKTQAHGFYPYVNMVYNVSGQINATASIGLPLAVAIGIDVLDGHWKKEVAVVDRPALEAVAEWSSDGKTSVSGCDGIGWYVDFVNEVTVDFWGASKYDLGTWHGPRWAQGCVGDDGRLTVSQQQQPGSGDKTRFGCGLVNDIVPNNGFDIITNGYVLPWTYRVSDPLMLLDVTNDDLATSAPEAMRIHIDHGADNSKIYTADFFVPVTICTFENYNVQLSARLEKGDGVCNLTQIQVSNPGDNRYTQTLSPNVPFYPTSPGKNFMTTFGPYVFAVPSFDNTASVDVTLAFRVTCQYSTFFDVRLDDFNVGPTRYAARRKRDLIPISTGTLSIGSIEERDDTGELYVLRVAPKDNSTAAPVPVDSLPISLQTLLPTAVDVVPAPTSPPVAKLARRADPTITQGTIPVLSATNAIPQQSAANQISAMSAVNHISILPENPSPTYPSGDQNGAADPTATASLIGPADYDFPAWEDIMASATLAPPATASTGPEPTSYLTLQDAASTAQLASAPDGNLYLAAYSNSASPGTQFWSIDGGSVTVADSNQRVFHYYPPTMSTYGVSRLRMASIADSPLTAQVITLVPILTPKGNAYAAIDTLGSVFLLAVCSAPGWSGSKVFLVKDYDASLTKLQSPDVQWVVTGAQVSSCAPLLLTSTGTPINPPDPVPTS